MSIVEQESNPIRGYWQPEKSERQRGPHLEGCVSGVIGGFTIPEGSSGDLRVCIEENKPATWCAEGGE